MAIPGPLNVRQFVAKLLNLMCVECITPMQGRIEGGFLRFQETPFDSPIIFKTA